MHRLLPISLLTFLLGCGGSDNPSLAERFKLQASAEAWENRMPIVIFPNEVLPCTSLIVSFSVTSSEDSLPPDFSAESVSLGKNSTAIWKAETSKSETGLSDAKTLKGIARGCRTDAFAEGDELNAIIRVKTRDDVADVNATVKLYYAF